ncbi:hypothetical protein [Pseudolactococcus piscium]|uniref:hypothetical protein n=1 Tax=Pseudolactococcus piscium TaxID=1364 RepID=UPI0012FDD2DD|nr:hypothetical protein [Lactococcus piscium]
MDIEQLTSKVTLLEAEISNLEEELKRINSKLNAVDSKTIVTKRTVHLDEVEFKERVSDLLNQLKPQQPDL